jgi:hypothetical protein
MRRSIRESAEAGAARASLSQHDFARPILYGGVALLALSNRSFREFSRFVDVRSSSTS